MAVAATLALLMAGAHLAGCSTRTTVRGTYAEVWEGSQQAVSAIRFKAADTGARHQRIEKDEQAGTIKYVWTDGGFFDARVLTLRFHPVETPAGLHGSPHAAGGESIDRTVTIEAWTWAFFGLMPAPDFSTAEIVRRSIEREFNRPPASERVAAGEFPPALPPGTASSPRPSHGSEPTRSGHDGGSQDAGS